VELFRECGSNVSFARARYGRAVIELDSGKSAVPETLASAQFFTKRTGRLGGDCIPMPARLAYKEARFQLHAK
jgi:hypothetical protein